MTNIWRLLALTAAVTQAGALASAQQVAATLAQDAPVTALALSPDGRLVAAGMKDGVIAVWDIRTQRKLHALPGSLGAIGALAFAPTGKGLASVSASDDKARLWDPAAGRELRALSQFTMGGTSQGFHVVAYAPDGVTVVLGEGGGKITLWNTATGAHQRMAAPHDAIVTGIAVTPDGAQVVSVDYTRRVRLRPLPQPAREPESLGTIGDPLFTGLAIAPDGVTLALGGSEKVYGKPQASYPITLWDLRTRKLVSSLDANPSPASALAFAAGGKSLGSVAPDNVVRLWSTVSRKQVLETPGAAFALSGAGTVLAVAQEKSVRIVRLRPGS